MESIQFSFEFFPPKTVEGEKNLTTAAEILAQSNPNFFSVTFGAGGSTRDGTIETVKMLQAKFPVTVVPHLSCIGCDKAELVTVLKQYQTMNVNRIVALRGDLPSGMGQAGELHYASDLVSLIRATSGDHFHITVAAYPEVHPQAKNAYSDLLSLKKKFEAGADCAITQYFFNPDAYFYFMDQCAKENISFPIIPGIMPIHHFNRLIQFSDRCGAEVPLWLRKRLEHFGDDSDSIKQLGLEVVYNLCEQLIQGGAPGLHFYTLNQAELSVKILRLLGVIA